MNCWYRAGRVSAADGGTTVYGCGDVTGTDVLQIEPTSGGASRAALGSMREGQASSWRALLCSLAVRLDAREWVWRGD